MWRKVNTILLSLIFVPAGASFQHALDVAKPGDTVSLQSGATFVGSFTLPTQSRPAEIVITSSGKVMAKVLSPGDNLPALTTAPGASHYRIENIEFGKETPEAKVTNLIFLDTGSTHITLDHVYAHGEPDSDLRRCITLNGADENVLNSRITECHEEGADSQGIAGWDGPGPYRIENNYIEAASENILFGGADPSTPGLVPSNIVIRGNTLTKYLSWKGKGYVVKNLFETKNARHVLVENNVMEHSWTDGQTGTAIVVKSANQEGACTWCVSEDINFKHNLITDAEEGVRINAAEGSPLPPKANHISFEGDRFENISGKLFQIFGGVENVTIDNVQGSSGTGVLFADTAPNPRLIIRHSYFVNPLYSIGAGSEEGQPYLDKWFPGAIVEGNTIVKSGPLPPRATPPVAAATKAVPPPPSPLELAVAKLMTWLKTRLGNGSEATSSPARQQ